MLCIQHGLWITHLTKHLVHSLSDPLALKYAATESCVNAAECSQCLNLAIFKMFLVMSLGALKAKLKWKTPALSLLRAVTHTHKTCTHMPPQSAKTESTPHRIKMSNTSCVDVTFVAMIYSSDLRNDDRGLFFQTDRTFNLVSLTVRGTIDNLPFSTVVDILLIILVNKCLKWSL